MADARMRRGATAASQFHERAVDAFEARGLRTTYAAIARVVGVRTQHYQGAVSGTRSVSVEAVAHWLVAWRNLGWPPFQIILTATDTKVIPVDSPPGA